MSGILDSADGEPIDWSGSGGDDGVLVTASGYVTAVRGLVFHRANTLPEDGAPETLAWLSDEHSFLTPVTLSVELDYWKTRAMRHQIAEIYDISLRDLGMPPRYGFDARYRQRQKNRRKRRR